MADQVDIDKIVDSFNNSPMAIFFPNIVTDAGQALVAALAEHIIDCDFENIRENCPNIWCCYAAFLIAIMLATWPVSVCLTTEVPAGELKIGDISDCGMDVQLFLKRKKTGMRECEWAQYKPSAKGCPPSALAQWSLRSKKMEEQCLLSQDELFMGGGSNWPSCATKCGCGSVADAWSVEKWRE